jgi:hypothetical protein
MSFESFDIVGALRQPAWGQAVRVDTGRICRSGSSKVDLGVQLGPGASCGIPINTAAHLGGPPRWKYITGRVSRR